MFCTKNNKYFELITHKKKVVEKYKIVYTFNCSVLTALDKTCYK